MNDCVYDDLRLFPIQTTCVFRIFRSVDLTHSILNDELESVARRPDATSKENARIFLLNDVILILLKLFSMWILYFYTVRFNHGNNN